MIDEKQINKIFELAQMEVPENITGEEISRALIQIENRLLPSATITSRIHKKDSSKVLIIDDLELSIYQLSLYLSKAGYDVNISRTAEEAKQLVTKKSFDFILIDLFMPNAEDGISLIQDISVNDKVVEKETKIIVISGTDDKNLIKEAYKSGANEFVSKDADWHKNILKYIKNIEFANNEQKFDIDYTQLKKSGKAVSLAFNPNLSADDLNYLEEKLLILCNKEAPNIIFNMKMVNSLNEEYLDFLIRTYKICSEFKGALKLYNVCKDVKDALSFVFLTNVIEVHNSLDDVLKS